MGSLHGSWGCSPSWGDPFPSSSSPARVRMELLNSQQPKGCRLGGLQMEHFGDRSKSWLLTLHCVLFPGSSPGDLCAHTPVWCLSSVRSLPIPGSPIPTSPSQEGAQLLSNCLASPPASSSILKYICIFICIYIYIYLHRRRYAHASAAPDPPASIYIFFTNCFKSFRCQILSRQLEEKMPWAWGNRAGSTGRVSPIHSRCPFPRTSSLRPGAGGQR